VPTDEILDHSPWHRTSNEDWGWTHDLTGLAPKDATGMASATLTIVAWDVDAEEGEHDALYAAGGLVPAGTDIKSIGAKLGLLSSYNVSPVSVPWSAAGQVGIYAQLWSTTSFDLPKDILDGLWKDGQIALFLNIDQQPDGFRVTLEHSTLAVNYVTSGAVPIPEPATLGLLGLGGLFLRRRRHT
jgi:hypothetical protein